MYRYATCCLIKAKANTFVWLLVVMSTWLMATAVGYFVRELLWTTSRDIIQQRRYRATKKNPYETTCFQKGTTAVCTIIYLLDFNRKHAAAAATKWEEQHQQQHVTPPLADAAIIVVASVPPQYCANTALLPLIPLCPMPAERSSSPLAEATL